MIQSTIHICRLRRHENKTKCIFNKLIIWNRSHRWMGHPTSASPSFWPTALCAWCACDSGLSSDGQIGGHTAAPDKRDCRADNVDPDAVEIDAAPVVPRTVDRAVGSQPARMTVTFHSIHWLMRVVIAIAKWKPTRDFDDADHAAKWHRCAAAVAVAAMTWWSWHLSVGISLMHSMQPTNVSQSMMVYIDRHSHHRRRRLRHYCCHCSLLALSFHLMQTLPINHGAHFGHHLLIAAIGRACACAFWRMKLFILF